MEPFTLLSGRAAPLLLANIDTDQIAPARFLKTPDRRGLGRILFHDLRRRSDDDRAGAFVLDRPEYAGASILLVGDNFGCGSSREHAPWAIHDAGIRCIIAPSFADIFARNALLNGLLPVTLPQASIEALALEAEGGHTFTVDLEAQAVTSPSGKVHRFEIDPLSKKRLLAGLDPISETLLHRDKIDAFEHAMRRFAPYSPRLAEPN